MLLAHIAKVYTTHRRDQPNPQLVEELTGKRLAILIPVTIVPITQGVDGKARVYFEDLEQLLELEETVEQLHAQLRGPLPVLHEGKRNPPPTEQEIKHVSSVAFAQSDIAILRKRYEDLLSSHSAQASRLANVLDALGNYPRLKEDITFAPGFISRYNEELLAWVMKVRNAALGKGPGE